MYPQDNDGGGAGKRYSTMTTGTFGMRDRDPLESLAEHEYVSYIEAYICIGAKLMYPVKHLSSVVQRCSNSHETRRKCIWRPFAPSAVFVVSRRTGEAALVQ
jgi:hypothetical protein